MVRHDNQKGKKQFPREHVDSPGTTARYGRNGLGDVPREIHSLHKAKLLAHMVRADVVRVAHLTRLEVCCQEHDA